MAKRSGLGMRLYIGGYDIGADVSAISSLSSPRGEMDITSIENSARARLQTTYSGNVSFAVYFDDATDAEHDALSGLPTADVLVMILFSTTAGDEVVCLTAKQINYDWTRGADGSLSGTVNLIGTSAVPLEWAELLKAKGTHASATDETGIDFGSQTTSGGVGYLQHFSAASGTVEYDLEDSSDSTNGVDGSWANLGAFTDVTTPYAATAERIAISGTVERWVRASTNGTFTTAVFAMAFRRRTSLDYDAA